MNIAHTPGSVRTNSFKGVSRAETSRGECHQKDADCGSVRSTISRSSVSVMERATGGMGDVNSDVPQFPFYPVDSSPPLGLQSVKPFRGDPVRDPGLCAEVGPARCAHYIV